MTGENWGWGFRSGMRWKWCERLERDGKEKRVLEASRLLEMW